MKRISLVLFSFLFLSISVSAQTPRLVFGIPEKVSPGLEANGLTVDGIDNDVEMSRADNPDASKPDEFITQVSKEINVTKSNKTLSVSKIGISSTFNENNVLIDHKSFVLSYNRSRGAANWVNWHLQRSDLGRYRKDTFHADILLPPTWRIPSTAYQHTGLQRGHMCPSKDRSTNPAINNETFVMSNMQPQFKEVNEITWGNLEDDTRKIINAGHEAYILAGCYGGNKTIFKGKVVVPSRCFKIVVVIPIGSKDLERVNRNTPVIAVIMPNDPRIHPDWRRFITTVDRIEAETGFDFLMALPDDIEKLVEAKTFQ